ncbi:MAG: hypothetical protein RIB67_07345 [Miltoncostaeaceae bacterium]
MADPLAGFYFPGYPLLDADGGPFPRAEEIYPPPYGIDQEVLPDGSVRWYFIYDRDCKRLQWQSPASVLFDEALPPLTALVCNFFTRAVVAERHIEKIEAELRELRQRVVARTGAT